MLPDPGRSARAIGGVLLAAAGLPARAAVSAAGSMLGSPMAKPRTHFTCQACGFQAAKWLGKCPDCGGWNTLVEELEPGDGRRAAWGAPSGGPRPVKLVDVEAAAEERQRTGIREL